MRILFLFLFFLFFSISMSGQDSSRNDLTSLEFGIGLSNLSDKYILPQNRQLGVTGAFRVRFESKNRKYAITPMVGIRDYWAPLEKESDVEDVLVAVRVGLIIDYNLYKNLNNNLFISNYLEICYSSYRNFLRQEVRTKNGYNQFGSTQDPDYKTKTLYRGSTPSIVLGYKLKYKYFFVDFGYDISKCSINYERDVWENLKTENPKSEEHPNVIFNSFNLQIGLSIPFKGLNWY